MQNVKVMLLNVIPVLLEDRPRKPVQHALHATGSCVEAAMAGSSAMAQKRTHTCT